jgi:hypothetical protein
MRMKERVDAQSASPAFHVTAFDFVSITVIQKSC